MLETDMASFLSRLFGGGSDRSTEKTSERGEPVAYEGYVIRAAPIPRDGQWLLAGVIIKQSDDAELERSFIRADTFTSREEAETFAVRKAKQIIDEQGERLFADGAASGTA